jgi:predicted NBD/HSP70 family sugar kinase
MARCSKARTAPLVNSATSRSRGGKDGCGHAGCLESVVGLKALSGATESERQRGAAVLAEHLVPIVNAINPSVMTLGGDLGADKMLASLIQNNLGQYPVVPGARRVTVRVARRGNRRHLEGAAIAWLQSHLADALLTPSTSP